MVKMKNLLLCFFILPTCLLAQAVTITAEVEENGVVGKTLEGSITVTHNESDKVDVSSFLLENKPLTARYVKDVRMSPDSPLLVTIYSFQLDPQKKGLHILPEVSATVGEKVYKSIPTSYEVKEQETIRATTPSQVVLGLEPFVDGKKLLYPGQRVRIGYRYIFNFSFDLSKEVVPLLEAKGFKKIGAKEFNDVTRNQITTLEVSQEIEAVKPGEYSFGPSVIQGRAYKVDVLGQKQYSRSEHSADAPEVTLRVAPFPNRGKPPSFNGAIGDFTFNLSLLSSPEVAVGDKIVIAIKISGKGELENLPMPEVCCQPGFSGFFRVSDLPPLEQVSASTKTFTVEMRPLSDSITEIPPLEFSFFNPETITYKTLRSNPIPLTVTPLKTQPKPVTPKPTQPPTQEPPKPTTAAPSAIEIEGNYQLTASDLYSVSFGAWWVLLIIPLGIGALFLQKNMKKFITEQQEVVKPKTSKDLFQEAINQKPGSPQFFQSLNQAFLLRLKELGEITDIHIPPERLPETGPSGEIRTFLCTLEEKRFAGKEDEIGADVVEEAKQLFWKMKRNRGKRKEE